MSIQDYLRHHTFAPGAERKLFAACWVISYPWIHREYSYKSEAIRLFWDYFDSYYAGPIPNPQALIKKLPKLATQDPHVIFNNINDMRLSYLFFIEVEAFNNNVVIRGYCPDMGIRVSAKEDDADIIFNIAKTLGLFILKEE